MKALNAILIATWLMLTIIVVWPIVSGTGDSLLEVEPPAQDGINYLVIAPPALAGSAQAWADYRQSTGYLARVVTVRPGTEPGNIRGLIQEIYFESGKPFPFFVLVMGHAHPSSSHPETFLPAPHLTVDTDKFPGYGPEPVASDQGYAADLSGNLGNTLPILIGRIPARTEEEAFRLLQRTREYEERPPTGEGRSRIELMTANAGFGTHYDPIFTFALRTLIQEISPDDYRWHLLDGNAQSAYNYPASLFPLEFGKRFDSGALAVLYIGHGQPEMLAWAYSPDGGRGRIFHFNDADLIKAAHPSLGIFTACSAGAYALEGDEPSVVEAIYLTPGGPAATYASSAWINGLLNGRLVIDILEALLVDKAPTLGQWVQQVESEPHLGGDRRMLTALLRDIIPKLSGLYQNNPFLSQSEARQELAIQHASYNLFGDPALRIAYPRTGMEISPRWTWLPLKRKVDFYGSSSLPAGERVEISLEARPAAPIKRAGQAAEGIELYVTANNPVIAMGEVNTQQAGDFYGSIAIPSGTSGGKYLLRAVASDSGATYIAARPVYLGWPPVKEALSSAVFWWLLTGLMLVPWERLILSKFQCSLRGQSAPEK